ncbi:two component system response regulator [Yersinia intermedia]|jgi:two-component system secretion response regulator SsrB|uniref:DNA-binding response regulator n=1 Tax=Yersinia intermedia TaxID=631 RepID=A0A208ZYS3_YERIN|nr:two component system response regulator [Yersinia intermedia]MCB5299015.1 two component system response regulator [Yersinia intermedia]MCB5314299.1 two component system response regulator [Yersinia intermedia]MCB5328165.1 two component system response regulator [Yersinia intermedia]OVZ85600.1 DNA-binding response regulator [Yersinia intermedia]UNK23154.1 two component system response regulator [Yersinia intermedia]
MNTKLLIVDDHELIINGIKNMLAAYPRYQIVGQADNGLEVYNLCRQTEPDIAIIDLGLPGMDGLDVIIQLLRRWPTMKILALTARHEEHHASRTLNSGALGYVLKKSPQQILMAAIQTVSVGKRYIDPALNSSLVNKLAQGTDASQPVLTPRERQILKLITEGACNRIIAAHLSISQKTVETHRLNMMKKLDVHKVAELIHWSYRLGLNE